LRRKYLGRIANKTSVASKSYGVDGMNRRRQIWSTTMMKTVYSALAAVALLAGTASFAADQTTAPATPVAATASTSTAAPAATPAKETVKATSHATKVKKEAAAPATESSATPVKK